MKTLVTEGTPWQELYRRLVEVVVPRPIALVSTVDPEGRPNLAPFSFFTVVSANPPYLAFSPLRSGRTGEIKDTLRNITATGQFVVHVVTEALAEAVNKTAASLPPGASEFEAAHLTPVPSQRVRPPRVKESPVALECELVEVRAYGEAGGAGNLVVGRILAVHMDEAVLDEEGRVAPERLKAVGRMGSEAWVTTAGTFVLTRPD